MDTLVLSSCMFFIPINLAAIRRNYVIMNVTILLMVTSWAHHSVAHVKGKHYCIYDTLDKLACYLVIGTSFIYSMLYNGFYVKILYMICLGNVFYLYSKVHTNCDYYSRGLFNWHKHKAHLLMHLSACLGLIIILFPCIKNDCFHCFNQSRKDEF